MKTYCKPAKVDVENTEFNIPAVRKAFDGKYKRRDFQRLLLNTGLVTEQELAQEFLDGTKQKIYTATDAYPSVTVECVMNLLKRDIGKNKVLIWYLGALMENYPGEHLCIGGYLPSWLFNYVMSYVLRYLLSLSQSRRGVQTKMVKAIVCYADDFTVYGYFSQLTKALKKATRWSKSTLGLDVKPAWQIYHISSFEEEKEFHRMRQGGSHKRTQGVDMMGFVVRRTYTIIRSRVFKRIRRQFLRAAVDLERLGYIPWWRACRIMAYKGWIKYSNSQGCSIKYNMQNLFKIAAQSVSRYGRKEYVKYEQRMLLIAAA